MSANIPVETESDVSSAAKKNANKQMLVFEDKSHIEHTLHSLNKLRRNKQFCDVILQVGSTKDIHEIHAHRSVLASVSPYLFDLFSTDSGNGHIRQYKFNGSFDLDAFQRLVDYAYTARLEVPRDKVKAVYMVANRLKMFEAAKLCGQYMASTLSPSNCISIRSIPGVSSDPDLLNSVDNYIRQNIEQVVKSTDLHALPKIQVELLQNSNEEMDATNERHLCDMVLDWIKKSFESDDLNMGSITEKVHMLYLNPDHTLHDCYDIENGDVKDSEIIQDYKKLSRRISVPPGNKAARKPKQKQNPPAKPRQFLYTRSDSSSSVSSIGEEDEKDWKIVATTLTGGHTIMALVVVTGKLCVLTVKQRLHRTPVSSPSTSRPGSVEKSSSYTVIPPMSSPRCAVGTAEMDGKLLVCGGYDRGECLRTVEAYDRATNKWMSLRQMLVPRGRFDIAVVENKVYAIGGCDGTKDLNSAEVMDFQQDKWMMLPSLPIVRSNAGACSLNEKIYVIGGWNGQRGLTRCDVYDPQTQVWTPIAHLTTGRYQAGVATLNGEVYAVGGCDTWNCLNSVEKYNPEADAWVTVSPMNTARRGCGVAVYKGKLYAVGGHDGVRSLCTVEIYDPNTNTWSAGPSLTSCRANVGVSLVGDRLYAVGGFNGKNFLNTIEYLDPVTNEWTTFVTKETVEVVDSNKAAEQRITNGDDVQEKQEIILKGHAKEFEKTTTVAVGDMRSNEKTPS